MMNFKNKPMILAVILSLLLAGCGSGGSSGGSNDVVTDPVAEGEASANSAPEIISAPKIFAKENTAYIYKVSAEDNEGDSLTFSLPTAPPGMEVNPDTGTISWIPGSSQGGEHDVTVQVDDGKDTDVQLYKVRVETAGIIASQLVVAGTGAQTHQVRSMVLKLQSHRGVYLLMQQ